jgi:hypothetical protein
LILGIARFLVLACFNPSWPFLIFVYCPTSGERRYHRAHDADGWIGSSSFTACCKQQQCGSGTQTRPKGLVVPFDFGEWPLFGAQ